MFTTTSVYFLLLFLIFWNYCGYLILLCVVYFLNKKGPAQNNAGDDSLKVAVLVPCYNEEGYASQKAENTKALNYNSERLEVFFLNGLSTDNTGAEIKKAIEGRPNFHIIETGCVGKINQLNVGLSGIKNDVDIVVCTDMDTLLAPDCLLQLGAVFKSDARVAAAGANITPEKAIDIEEMHWSDQNFFRILESVALTSSIVVAPCYAFRRGTIDRFPDDCVADDIYIAFKANTDGHIVKYVESAAGRELRVPRTFSEYFSHKFRKGNAYMIELLRFFYRMPHMSGWWKMIYITKFLQVVIMPWLIPYFLLSSLSLLLSGWGLAQIPVMGIIFLFISLVATSSIIRTEGSKFYKNKRLKIGLRPLVFLINNFILIVIGLSYPFYKQDSAYSKLGKDRGL